jgi:hypothetical protein
VIPPKINTQSAAAPIAITSIVAPSV